MSIGKNVGWGVKLISLLLIIGGLAGIAMGLWTEIQTLRQLGIHPRPSLAILGLFILLFGWCVWTGLALWKGNPRAFTWAKIIFTAQILNFTVPGISFDGFYTGLRVYVMVSQLAPNIRVGFDVETGIHFLFSDEITNWLFGVNFVAIAALSCLLREIPSKSARPDRLGLI